MTLTSDLNIKIIFSPWIWVWQNVFALWHRHTKSWHMDVLPWDNMLCTFLTLVWPWPLIYMRVAGGILSEFYSQFLSCFFQAQSSSSSVNAVFLYLYIYYLSYDAAVGAIAVISNLLTIHFLYWIHSEFKIFSKINIPISMNHDTKHYWVKGNQI